MGQSIKTAVGVSTFVVPAGVTSIDIKVWGAGGGGGGVGTPGVGMRGGGGGFATYLGVSVTPAETLDTLVGGGGPAGAGITSGGGGAGGGRTEVVRSTTRLAVAGGGGGGGGGDNQNVTGGVGGEGGGSTGAAGGNVAPSSTSLGGGGGTQAAGGAGGTGPVSNGVAGSSLTGGAGGDTAAPDQAGGIGTQGGGDGGDGDNGAFGAGGGGGAGFFGGGGGASSTSGQGGGAGGGGGSNLASGSTTNAQASGATGAGQGDGDYQAATGDGGSGEGVNGEPGAIVINWVDPPAVDFEQVEFRGRNDDGTETTATWKAAENTNWNQKTGENFRVRFNIQETSDAAATDISLQLQYNKNAEGWLDVNASSLVCRSSASANVTDGLDTTEQMAGTGPFVTPNGGFDEVDGLAGGTALDYTTTINQDVELEFCCQLRAADTQTGDTVQLRVVQSSGTPFTTYTATPTLTIPAGAGMMLASAEKKLGVAAAENPAAFNFQKSLPWGAISIAIKRSTASGGQALAPTSKFNTISTRGTVTIADGAEVDGLTFNCDVILEDALDLTGVTINGDLHIATGLNSTLNFTNVTVSGDVLNDSAGNTLTINKSGGAFTTTEPGTGNGQVSIVASVTITITCIDSITKAAIEGVNVRLGTAPGLIDVMDNVLTNASGIATVSYGGATPDAIEGFAAKGSEQPVYIRAAISGTVTSSGFSTTVPMNPD